MAIEVRPEDYNAGRTVNNPWDMNEVVLPYANENKLSIEPIDWWPDNLRSLYTEAIENLKKTSDGSRLLLELEDEWSPHATDFPDFNEVTPEYIHSELFAQREFDYRVREKAKLGEGPQNLMWYTRADAINKNLSDALKKHSGKRITIVVGASHRALAPIVVFKPYALYFKAQNATETPPLCAARATSPVFASEAPKGLICQLEPIRFQLKMNWILDQFLQF